MLLAGPYLMHRPDLYHLWCPAETSFIFRVGPALDRVVFNTIASLFGQFATGAIQLQPQGLSGGYWNKNFLLHCSSPLVYIMKDLYLSLKYVAFASCFLLLPNLRNIVSVKFDWYNRHITLSLQWSCFVITMLLWSLASWLLLKIVEWQMETTPFWLMPTTQRKPCWSLGRS